VARRKNKTIKSSRYYWIQAAILLMLSAYLSVCLLGFEVGAIGGNCAKVLRSLFGYGAFYVPLFLSIGSIYLFFKKESFLRKGPFWGVLVIAFFSLLVFHHGTVAMESVIMPENFSENGGLFACMLIPICRKYLGEVGTWIFAGGGFAVGCLYCCTYLLPGIKKYRFSKVMPSKEKPKELKKASAPLGETKEAPLSLLPKTSEISEKSSKKKFFDYQKARYPFEEDEENSDFQENSMEKITVFDEMTDKLPIFQGIWRRKSIGPVPWEEGYEEYIRSEQQTWEREKEQIRELAIQPDSDTEWEFIREDGTIPTVRKKEIGKEKSFSDKSTSVSMDELQSASAIKPVYEPLPSFSSENVVPTQNEIIRQTPALRPREIRPYQLPSLNLLNNSEQQSGTSKNEIRDKALLLEKTLAEFGVRARVIAYSQGPAVTRFELELAPGVKVNKILNLTDDLALKLATSGIRIEAPIPGKAAVGIEVPNQVVTSVSLKDVLDTSEFKGHKSKVSVGLGKDIAGTPIVANLAEMPHLLVAGATGSGKSVCINTIITSILFKALPTEVKFILVDPKMVELTHYNDIPHLLTPVVNDPKQAAAALKWAVREMERRYSLLAAASVRDMNRYNELAEVHNQEKLPQIVVIIDELADLMMVTPVEVQDAICRLAQMARAAGIHLILATQRPSVDVITGLIKANIPSRISFAVSSQVDSRTILDVGGAEKLLGKGDMLFAPAGMAKPLRVQGAFISDVEVEKLLDFVKNQNEGPEYVEGVTSDLEAEKGNSSQTAEEFDELWKDVLRIVMETGQASSSMLQRRFRIGFSRAGRLIDQMEMLGIVGPPQGSKPRELMMSPDQIEQMFFASAQEE